MIATPQRIALQWLWQALPKKLRRKLVERVMATIAPKPSTNVASNLPLVVCGLLSSSTGFGWAARETVRAIENTGISAQSTDLSSLVFAEDLPNADRKESSAILVHGKATLLFYAMPPQIPYFFYRLGKQAIDQKHVIGCMVWELPDVPDSWKMGLNFVHQVWCPSAFSANAFKKITSQPVNVVPYPVERPETVTSNRAHFGIPSGAFTVLIAIHLSSGLARKNPVASIRAFKTAFGRSETAHLIVKVSQGNAHPDRLSQIQSEIADVPNIQLFQETLSNEDYWSFLASTDAILSLHRSEGFGLVLAQAMAISKPVVATNWSANAEYMDVENSMPVEYKLIPVHDPDGEFSEDGQEWAEPNEAHAAQCLVQLANSPELCRRLGMQAEQTIKDNFSFHKVGQIIKTRLDPEN